MSRQTKIIIALAGSVIVLCCVGGIAIYLIGRNALGQAIVSDPTQAAQVGHQIADYTLPPDYAEQTAMNLGGIQMVMITSANPTPIIMLMQFPATMSDPEAMRKQMEQSASQQSANLKVVGQQEATIKGETVTLTIREGTDSAGKTMRQVSGIFQGKQGPTMMMIMGDTAKWDQKAIDEFISSIR